MPSKWYSALSAQDATRTFWGHAKAPSYAIIAFSRLISSNAIANDPFAAAELSGGALADGLCQPFFRGCSLCEKWPECARKGYHQITCAQTPDIIALNLFTKNIFSPSYGF